MPRVTHCVSASDARALTQMDTNTAGTPVREAGRGKRRGEAGTGGGGGIGRGHAWTSLTGNQHV